MPDYAVLYQLSIGRERRTIVEAMITDPPADATPASIASALEASVHAADYSERGYFLANRKIVTAGRIPTGATTDGARTLPWAELGNDSSVQFNIRVPSRQRAAWRLAAERTGEDLRTWTLRVLGDAAGVAGTAQPDTTAD